jgi:hypothetical protein
MFVPVKKPGQLDVGEHAVVEVGDDDLECLVTADPVIDACHEPSENRPRFGTEVCALPGCKIELTPSTRGV